MNGNEVLQFLLPQFNDRLQLIFFTIISLMIVCTVISAHRTARAESWERKWNRGTPNDDQDDLDIEHGTVTDLWQAIATAPEKLAEIMPGMLLIVGLLGTFIGLGLALNHASSILGKANALSANGAVDSMQDLLGLLQGLGTKFKTSTWGITGFVLLKIWSEATRFEEKRMTWVIGKVKAELEKRKQAKTAHEAARQENLFVEINRAAGKIVDGIAGQITALLETGKTLHQQTLQQIAQGIQGVRGDLDRVHIETRDMNSSMAQFTQSTQEVVEKMADAAQRMAGGADKVGSSANELQHAVKAFEGQFKEVLDKVGTDLGNAILVMSTQASETFAQGSFKLEGATQKISTALDGLSDDVKQTMLGIQGSIDKAQKIQQKAAIQFASSSDALNESIKTSEGVVEKMGGSIQAGLDAVSSSNLRMRNFGEVSKKSTESLEKVIGQLNGLYGALSSVTDFADRQNTLLATLKPLGRSVGLQEAIVQQLQSLRSDLKSRVAIAEAPAAEPA